MNGYSAGSSGVEQAPKQLPVGSCVQDKDSSVGGFDGSGGNLGGSKRLWSVRQPSVECLGGEVEIVKTHHTCNKTSSSSSSFICPQYITMSNNEKKQ